MMSMGLRLRLAFDCKVCRQVRDEAEVGLVHVDAALFGAAAYAICPACAMPVRDHRDRNYRRRVDRFLKRKGDTT